MVSCRPRRSGAGELDPSALMEPADRENDGWFDHGKEDGVEDLLLVRQPLFADLCLKVVDTVSKLRMRNHMLCNQCKILRISKC